MQLSLRSPAVRAAFLKALARTGFMNQAAAAAGISPSAVNQYRKRHADFAEACDEVRAGAEVKPGYMRWTPAIEAAFLEALAETGNAYAAARRAGTTERNAYRRRNIEAPFAAAWACAKQEAVDRLEDRLFEGALSGFVSVRESGGVVSTKTSQRPDVMLKPLARRRELPAGHRPTIFTPEMIRSARHKYERTIVHAIEMDRARAAAAGLPELAGPPWHGLDAPLSTLPPPRM